MYTYSLLERGKMKTRPFQTLLIRIVLLTVVTLCGTTASAQLTPGNVLVGDPLANKLLEVNPQTGTAETLGQGGYVAGISAIATNSLDTVYWGNTLRGVFELDVASGDTHYITSANLVHQPRDARMSPDGKILFADRWGGSAGYGAILRIDPASGTQEELSSFPPGEGPFGLDLDANDDVVTITSMGTSNDIRRIDLETLDDELIMSADGLDVPTGLAFGPDGWLYVANVHYRVDLNLFESEIVRIDLSTGIQELVSLPSEFRYVSDIDFDDDGTLYLADYYTGYDTVPPPPPQQGLIYAGDPTTGQFDVVYDPDDLDFQPMDIFIVPIPEPAMLLPLSFAFVLLPLRRR